MTEKQQYAFDKIMAQLPETVREPYREVAEYAVSLGYMPLLKGAHESYADFVKSKTKRTILKIDTDPKFPPRLGLKFFALPTYPDFLEKAVVARAMQLKDKGYEARCYGCGRCSGSDGYTFTLPDGEHGFWCGRDIISLPSLSAQNVPEVKEALRAQDDFFMKQVATGKGQ